MGFPTKGQLRTGFYSSSCPRAEDIVRSTVEAHFKNDTTIAPGLLRLHFHDCFVRGCDASILIKGSSSEMNAIANGGLRGFEVIDDAKAQLESLCPGIVSCADILALAARDGVDLIHGPSWGVPTGRRDGKVSLSSEVTNMPSPFDSIDVQKQKFAAKGLNDHDLVTLSGAHTIGHTSCLFVGYRLYNFTRTGNPDPTLDQDFLTQLQGQCPKGVGSDSKRIPLDKDSPLDFDAGYFKNVRDGKAVLESDQRLLADPDTRDVVETYASKIKGLLGFRFEYEFGKAMVKMSNIEVNVGAQGEIRKICSKFN
ncbi:peroxidase 25 [Impatiens glandulifera]|uniref:peroxidase 25 n=1 Tax=Impatiens glandulifera TaxID=253017 RepID=UPI001FB059FF|nr:peroxidase 25 [Impatiens glandulifera]